MPLAKKWSDYTSGNIRNIPNVYGVYELGYNKRIIYIGSGELAHRIQEHEREAKTVTNYRFEKTGSRKRARQRERAELKEYRREHGRLPKYNDRIPPAP